MTVHRTTLACCVVFSAFLPGCSHSVPVQSYTEPDAVPPTPVVIEVENHNWADVVLYVLHDGIQTRFAQVAAAEREIEQDTTRYLHRAHGQKPAERSSLRSFNLPGEGKAPGAAGLGG